MLLKRISVVASLALLAGCGDKSTGVVSLSGLLMFTYSGGMTGNYSAQGALPATAAEQNSTEWAASDLGTGTVFASAIMPRDASSHDYAQLTVRRTTAGTETLTAGCASNCSRLYVMFGAPNTSAGGLFLQECTMTVGTITITAISSKRVSGTFSGTGTCTAALGGAPTSFTVTNGSFDTAILPNV